MKKRHSWSVQVKIGGRWRVAHSRLRTKREAKERQVWAAIQYSWRASRIVKVER